MPAALIEVGDTFTTPEGQVFVIKNVRERSYIWMVPGSLSTALSFTFHSRNRQDGFYYSGHFRFEFDPMLSAWGVTSSPRHLGHADHIALCEGWRAFA